MSRAESNLGPRSTAHCVVHGRSTSRITRGAATIGLVCGVCVVAAYSELLRQPADSALTSGAIGTIGVHATHRALDATGELKCGVLWFLHIPKTGGDTVKGSLKSWSRRYKRHKKFSASSRWTYVDLYQKTCEPGLNSTNMEDWAAAPSWSGFANNISDTVAVRRACGAARRNGGGRVVFTAGVYLLNTAEDPFLSGEGKPIPVTGSNIVLQGAGRGIGGTIVHQVEPYLPRSGQHRN